LTQSRNDRPCAHAPSCPQPLRQAGCFAYARAGFERNAPWSRCARPSSSHLAAKCFYLQEAGDDSLRYWCRGLHPRLLANFLSGAAESTPYPIQLESRHAGAENGGDRSAETG
jgi:hypothetical protein